MFLRVSLWLHVLVKQRGEDLFAGRAVHPAFVQQIAERRQTPGRNGQAGFDPLGSGRFPKGQPGEDLAQQQIGQRRGIPSVSRRPHKIIRQPLFVRQKLRRLAGQAVLLLEKGAFFVRQHRQRSPESFQLLRRKDHRRQVGFREIAVIARRLFSAHDDGLPGALVKAQSLLQHRAARVQNFRLPGVFGPNGPFHALEGVQILHFRAGAHGLARTAKAQVHIAAEAALVHAAVADPGGGQDGPQLFQIGAGFLRRAKVRLGHDLDQGHAATVQVDSRYAGPVVQQLARVFLHVDAGNADAFRSPICENFHKSRFAQGVEKLGDLIGLGQVGIKEILAVEAADRVHTAI